MPSTTDAAVAYLRRRERLLLRLERVNAAISRRNEWEADVCLPDDLRRDVPQPVLSRDALAGLHRMLVEELGRLDGPRRAGARQSLACQGRGCRGRGAGVG